MTKTKTPMTLPPEKAADVRAWAKAEGLSVGDRGRISADILEKYRAAQK